MRTKITMLLFSVTTIAFSQIKILTTEKAVTIGKISNFGGGYDFLCEKVNDTYLFSYRDISYTQLDVYKDFEFADVDNAFEDLYTLLINAFETPPEEDVLLELPNGLLLLHFVKAMGIVNVNLTYSENGTSGTSGWLTKRKVLKLFGKK